ncbi:hypothetical protein [Ligilactobacillus aviarius]|uniref:hypothetical protein n=1 Tax=Ligilactobacillus aviarius TaxID=1606 RepID=UPI0024BB64BD|nr:hypothetical protein [Ligilactobacillus aviarius]
MTEKKEDLGFLLRKQHELEDSTDDLKKNLVKIDEIIENNQQMRMRFSKENVEEESELINSQYYSEISEANTEIMNNYNQISRNLTSCRDELQQEIDKNQEKLEELDQQIIKQEKEEDDDGKNVSK